MYKWEEFLENKVKKIFTEKKVIIDIGGGLRIRKNQGDKYDPKRDWINSYMDNVDYKTFDLIADYKPDIIGDIHKLPFDDNSIDSIICLFVLEHVKNPCKAVSEIHRVLKPGGLALVGVPFIRSYHNNGYYKDYWRFTKDGVEVLFSDFKNQEIVTIMGPVMTLIYFSHIGKSRLVMWLAHVLDVLMGKTNSKQVYGYGVFLEK
jgi:predicted SAM-dependent methyltransferase